MVNVSNEEIYHKRHLVPLGEYIPLRVLIEFFNRFVKIPMSDIASGDEDQVLMSVADVPAGITICFEEAFARDVIKDLPEGVVLKEGNFGENLTTEGIVLHTLPIGTRLKIGTGEFEVTQIGKACHLGCAIRSLVGNCIMPKQGIFAIVVKEGFVQAGDKIEIVNK